MTPLWIPICQFGHPELLGILGPNVSSLIQASQRPPLVLLSAILSTFLTPPIMDLKEGKLVPQVLGRNRHRTSLPRFPVAEGELAAY